MNAKIWRLAAVLLTLSFIMGCASFEGNGPEPKRLPDEWKETGSHADPDR